MKKKRRFFFALMFLGGANLVAISIEQNEKLHFDQIVELTYRTLQPGEVILASLKGETNGRRAILRFRAREYILAGAGKIGANIVFIGLDLGTEPGSYPMTISLEKPGGPDEVVSRDIVIKAREFPSKKLWVKEDYAVPPKALEERIRRESEFVASIYGLVTDRWLGEGDFIVPHGGQAFPNFGQRRIYNNRPRSIHGGVDIAAPRGSPILAANTGKIVLASDLYLSGKTIIIDHGLGVFSSYGHLSKILSRRGALVHKGEIIGRSGSTGRSTGPHLHWGIRIFDARVDPFSLLSLRITH